MQAENYQIVIGVVIGIVVLLIAASFIFILVTYSNARKNKFMQEKQHLQLLFKEQLLQSQLEMQEQTFNSISQEIHDNVGQLLSLAKVQVNIIEQGETLDRSMLKDVKENVGKAMTDLRDIAKSLNSDRIRLSSLVETTDHELQRINKLGFIEASLSVEGTERNIDEQKKLILLRILQESLQNILKHAKAKKIEVVYKYTDQQLQVEIIDNGVGFIAEQVGKTQGLGLQNMINRAALIGGQVFIKSNINDGTSITITLPYV